ncbi:MAG TPA: GMC family oxidoreductase N-terminal domain-containing protein [Solirubrobacterales bacterium]|nr:GMC family oxidoreductase N-terminal domain-containing protein [Solirubrobacterales bacterium]
MPEDESTGGGAADFIVVGAGSAGAAVAYRLVARGAKVLLLEAGGAADNPAIHDPARSHELWDAVEDWGFRTVPQAACAGRRLHLPRGRVLGGSSSLNAMIYVRGAPADYDGWADGGADGWAWEDVLPVFLRLEDFRGESEAERGRGGPVTVIAGYEPDPIHRAIAAAAVETGIEFNPDYNSGRLDGVSFTQLTIRDGRRHGTAEAYLAALAGEPRLIVRTGAEATRLLLAGDRCVGVEWTRDGRLERAGAGEVILAAGAIGSPHLLLRSGIGPAAELRAAGVVPLHDLVGVGRNLHDHLLAPVIFAAERDLGTPAAGLPQPQSHLFWRSRPGLTVPDTQPIHFNVPLYEPWMEGPENGFSLMAGMIRPLSRGTVRLAGADPTAPPLIDLAALSREADLEALAASVALCREIGAAPSLAHWGARELYPGPEIDDAAALRDYVRRTAITYHHQVGTCKMGDDELAVVDPTLRVHGIEGLRVADASVMPTVITGNTNAPAIMIGERAADFVAPVAA